MVAAVFADYGVTISKTGDTVTIQCGGWDSADHVYNWLDGLPEEIRLARGAPIWMPADNRKPPPRFEVLLTDGENVFTGIWSGQQWETHGEDGYDYVDGITHWMPLPGPPR
jgi:hypothetical protein